MLYYTLRKKEFVMNYVSSPVIKRKILPDLSKISNVRYHRQIKNFLTIIKESVPKEDCILIYNNLPSLKILSLNKNQNSNSASSPLANYNIKDNTIKLFDGENSLYHELWHVSSSIYKDKISYSGFCQISNKKQIDIGRGINEGYTELLTLRFFKDYDTNLSYNDEIIYALCVEKIIGELEMMKMYLNADLNGLISSLERFSNKTDAINFITSLDYFSKNIKNENSAIEIDELVDKVKCTKLYLYRCYVQKVYEEYNLHQLDIDEAIKKVEIFLKVLGTKYSINGKYFDLFEKDEINGEKKWMKI